MKSPTCQSQLIIEVPPDVVERESEQVTAQYARLARIPGFRPGRAPRTLVGQRFRDEIRSEVVHKLILQYFQDKVREEKLPVIGEPRFEDLRFEEGQPLRAQATFEVYPQIELKEYQGLEVEAEVFEVAEVDVDEAVERLRQRAATFEVVEGGSAADGDYVMASYRGRVLDDLRAEPLEAREGLIHLGGRATVAAFTENLRGSRPGEVREFDASYPQDFPQKRLAGRRVHYRAEVLAIKKKVVPAVDDELAKSVSEFTTLAELRQRVREDLARQNQGKAENIAKRKLLAMLVAGHEFPLPQALVETQVDHRLRRVLAGLAGQGVDPRTAEIDWGRMREELRAEAERDVRESLILDRIAEAERIEVSEQEIDAAVVEIAAELGETPAAVKTRLTREDGLARLKTGRRHQKVLDFIYHKAKINHKAAGSGRVEAVDQVGPAAEGVEEAQPGAAAQGS